MCVYYVYKQNILGVYCVYSVCMCNAYLMYIQSIFNCTLLVYWVYIWCIVRVYLNFMHIVCICVVCLYSGCIFNV